MPVLPGEIAVLVLAAGGGSRLGGGKMLLPWKGVPLVLHPVRAALAMRPRHPVFVVVGHEADPVRRALEGDADIFANVRILENGRWREGQSGSLRIGVEAVHDATKPEQLRGLVVMLGDQPLVETATLNLLAERHLAGQAALSPVLATRPVYNGRRGNPAVLSPDLFPRIARLRGDAGARGILRELGDRLLEVPVPDPGVVRDIDTMDDYEALTGSRR